MKKTLTLAMSAATALSLFSAVQMKQQHVPERLDQIRLIHPAAAKKNHILIANVGNAVPTGTWDVAVTYAVSRLQLNVWTNSVARFDGREFFAEPTKVQRDFGEKAKVGLFIVNQPGQPRFFGAPGFWYAANACGIEEGAADAQTVRDRYAKLILKGLAYACGGGASLEPTCSLFYGSFTPKGMDGTGIMISPTTYFPMLEILRGIGGPEMLTPAIEE